MLRIMSLSAEETTIYLSRYVVIYWVVEVQEYRQMRYLKTWNTAHKSILAEQIHLPSESVELMAEARCQRDDHLSSA